MFGRGGGGGGGGGGGIRPGCDRADNNMPPNNSKTSIMPTVYAKKKCSEKIPNSTKTPVTFITVMLAFFCMVQ